MARLVGVPEQIDWTFWDTLVATDGPVKLERRTSLFGSTNIGRYHMTNMMVPGCLPCDNTFVVLSTPTLVNFADESLYGVVARDVQVDFIVGDKSQGRQRLPMTMVRGEKPSQTFATKEEFSEQYERMVDYIKSRGVTQSEHQNILSALYSTLPGALKIPLPIPPRQSFHVDVDLWNDAHAIIGNAKGCKSIVHCLRGILTRDVY